MKFSCRRKYKKCLKAFYLEVYYHDNGYDKVKLKDIIFPKKEVRLRRTRRGNKNDWDLSGHVWKKD
jgi:hypothetical protein